jgi:hypothetical protein
MKRPRRQFLHLAAGAGRAAGRIARRLGVTGQAPGPSCQVSGGRRGIPPVPRCSYAAASERIAATFAAQSSRKGEVCYTLNVMRRWR